MLKAFAAARLALCGWTAAAALDVPLPVYGVVNRSQLTSAQSGWFAANAPAVFTTLQVGSCTLMLPDGVPGSVYSSFPIYHAVLVPVVNGRDPGPYALAGYTVSRIEAITQVLGNAQAAVIADFTSSPITAPAFSPSTISLQLYGIDGSSVYSIQLTQGFVFPTETDAQQFRWWSSALRMSGSRDGMMLSGGGSDLCPLAMCAITSLASYAGAWVQLAATGNSRYLYVQQSSILTTSGIYDPVMYNGGFLAGGLFSDLSPSSGSALYSLSGQQTVGQFQFNDALLATSLPADIAALALASEAAAPQITNANTTVNDSAANRGSILQLDESLQPTGAKVEFFSGGQNADQSTATVASAVLQQSVLSQTATDNAPVAGYDRIHTPTSGAGSSGLDQLQAQDLASTWSTDPSLQADGATQVISHGVGADGTQISETISADTYLQAQDAELNAQVLTTYNDQGKALPPQQPPIALLATGTVSSAVLTGGTQEYYDKADAVNVQMAPHLENTLWPGGLPAVYHKAIILPMDFMDDWMVQRYGPATGIAIPDKLGIPIPGDGTNPIAPVPQGCLASHPFYDVDGDGCLDRWYSNDPYDAGYRKLRISWAVDTGPAKQLGSFTFQPDNNVVVSGLKKPRLNDQGQYAVQEDLLFSIGHPHLPFDHRTLTWRGFQTYYSSSLISPLDPINANDPSQYQLAIRHVPANTQASSGSDGADPAQLVPDVQTAQQQVTLTGNGGGTSQPGMQVWNFSWYDGLASSISTHDPWVWQWSPTTPVFPPGISDRPLVPVVLVEEVLGADGTILQQTTYRRPVFVDPDAGPQPFDPSLITVSDPATPAVQAMADSYMWDYPVALSSAQGGAQRADPAQWLFPWNVAWNADAHSQRYSAQTFSLNSANLLYFPAYAGMSPVITHAGLSNQAALTGSSVSAQWLLQENQAGTPSANQTLAAWRDGQAFYAMPGWIPGQEWLSSGRSPVHLFDYDARSDLWSAGHNTGGCIMPTGQRVFDVVGGFASYVFRGQAITVSTTDQQIALLQRMWNYSFTGYEYPQSTQTCLPSILIPQRFDNGDPLSPPLNSATIAQVESPGSTSGYISDDSNDVDHAGALGGALTAELSAPAAQQQRIATQRRIHLLSQQLFLFSAARGREWELDMARRMPASTTLLCLEYDDKEQVKAVLSGRVVFPTTQVTTVTDGAGVSNQITQSNELDLLRNVAQCWFDGTVIDQLGYANGEMGTTASANGPGTGYALQAIPAGNSMQTRTGSAATTSVASSIMSTSNGFLASLPGNMPAALAHYCYYLRSRPMYPEQQWRVDANQTQYHDMVIEFRHPMLLLYHDQAGSIYIHYGRNCEPNQVFGAWNQCASPPASINATSSEFLRRESFKSWQTTALLENIYDQFAPSDYARYLTSLVPLPAAPPDPGPCPPLPQFQPFPGIRPVLLDSDPGQEPVFDELPPWQGLPAYDGMSPEQAATAYLDALQPIPPLDWSISAYTAQGFADPLAVGNLAGGYGYPVQISVNDHTFAYVNGYFQFSSSFTCISPMAAPVTGTIYCDDDGTLLINQQFLGYFIYQQGLVPFTYDFLPGQTYDIVVQHQGYNTPNVLYLSLDSPAYDQIQATVSAWLAAYQQWQQADTSWQNAESSYLAALSTYQVASQLWNSAMAGYLGYLQMVTAYPAQLALWTTHNTAFSAWSTNNSQQIALIAWAQQWLIGRADWVADVQAISNQPGVSWPGDPTASISSLSGFQALQPQIPIWQAYEWFVDPANAVTAALPQAVSP